MQHSESEFGKNLLDYTTPKRKKFLEECKVATWSFNLHPVIVAELLLENTPDRYFILIKSLRTRIFSQLVKLLKAQVNLNAYYAGGLYSFVCDYWGTPDEYGALRTKIMRELGNEIRTYPNAYCAYKVEEYIVQGRKHQATIPAPTNDAVDFIKEDFKKFDAVYRNYMADETWAMFKGGMKGVKKYLKELEKRNIIVSYKPVADRCRFFDVDYVALCSAITFNSLETSGENSDVFSPIVDAMGVSRVERLSPPEVEITHVLVNHYRNRDEKHNWRESLQSRLEENVNVLTFPLECSFKQELLCLSDLPRAITLSEKYSGGMRAFGYLSHPHAEKNKYPIGIPVECFNYQGITLGRPGSGKTNTDCVLISEFVNSNRTVIALDSTKCIREKVAETSLEAMMEIIDIDKMSGTDEEYKDLMQNLTGPKLYVMEGSSDGLRKFFNCIATELGAQVSANVGNAPRHIEKMLLIEEAHQIFDDESLLQLKNVLLYAFRKGWCFWLSTQSPTHLGQHADELLKNLRNWVVHPLDDNDLNILRNAVGPDGLANFDSAVQAVEKTMKIGVGFLRAVKQENGLDTELPAVPLRVVELA